MRRAVWAAYLRQLIGEKGGGRREAGERRPEKGGRRREAGEGRPVGAEYLQPRHETFQDFLYCLNLADELQVPFDTGILASF